LTILGILIHTIKICKRKEKTLPFDIADNSYGKNQMGCQVRPWIHLTPGSGVKRIAICSSRAFPAMPKSHLNKSKKVTRA